jgi:ribosomal protein L7Ae-like RNA K-turn-binding protein
MDKAKDLNVLILNAPCNGFGDIIFAFKLYKIMKSVYNCHTYIATPDKDKMMMLGKLSDETVILLTDKNGKHPGQCRRYGTLKMHTDMKFDLILPAPIAWDFKFSLKDVKNLIPYANKHNTFAFSEYNDYLDKGMYFNTGIGKGRLGLLLLPVPKTKERLIRDKYALAYLNTIDSTTPRWRGCLKNFINMVTDKYKFRRFQLIVSPPMMDYLKGVESGDWYKKASITKKELRNTVNKHYHNILLIDKPDAREQLKHLPRNENTFIIRGDILPVPNETMLQYIEHSVNDILITGDQSITDVLSCCPTKNIWYQIAPWKENLGSQLAKQMHNKYLASKRTSCGTVKAKFKSNYKEFIKKNDFVKNFRPLMDEIILSLINKEEESGIKRKSRRSKRRSKRRTLRRSRKRSSRKQRSSRKSRKRS